MPNDERFEKLITDLTQKDKLDMALALQIASHSQGVIEATSASVKEDIAELRNELRQTNVGNLRRIIALEENVKQLKDGLETSRAERADHEVKEAELRLQLAKTTRAGLSTQERIEVKKEVTDQLEKTDAQKTADRNTIWKKRFDTMVTAIMVSLGVSAAVATLGFIGWLVSLYLSGR